MPSIPELHYLTQDLNTRLAVLENECARRRLGVLRRVVERTSDGHINSVIESPVADELERLRKENADLRKALEDLAHRYVAEQEDAKELARAATRLKDAVTPLLTREG